ncbi:endothelin-converting enzyme 1-like [Amblyomma americanum]
MCVCPPFAQTAVRKASAVSWLDKITRRNAAEKIRSVRTVLWPAKKFLTAQGLEEAYANFTDNASSFASFWIETRRSLRALVSTDAGLQELLIGDSIAQPYAQYEHVMNRLSLSLGALVPPLYYKSGTRAMQYGGLGYFYAKELVGAVDTEGVKYMSPDFIPLVDPRGHIVSSWLSDGGNTVFEKRVLGCLISSKSSVFPEVQAIEVAYAAFKKDLADNNLQLSTELTEEKVFFITACLISCSKTAADNLYGGECNKAVANFAPFAEAFHCPAFSNMNPATKCTFFD